MDIKKAKKIMEVELECVLRQDTPKCNRDTCGCQCCDLIQETEDVVAAYNFVLSVLDLYDVQIQKIIKPLENAQLDPKSTHESR